MYTVNGTYGTGLTVPDPPGEGETPSPASDPGGVFVAALIEVMENPEQYHITTETDVDSTAPGNTNPRQLAILQAIADNNLIELDKTGIQSWAIRKEGGYNIAWFSDQDINGLEPGTMVRVIRYNSNLKTYTAGYMKIERKPNKGDPYSVFAGGLGSNWVEYVAKDGEPQTDDGTKQSYEETLRFFEEMPASLR